MYKKAEGEEDAADLKLFDGHDWKLMDPTFASSGKQSREIMQYIGNGSNYKAKYSYQTDRITVASQRKVGKTMADLEKKEEKTTRHIEVK